MPLNNLGLIIVDEEQESSYKQTNLSPFYHARDVAIMRAKISNSIIMLCSSTPSIETYFNFKNNNFKYYYLDKRFKNFKMPSIKIIDMTKEIYDGNKYSIISDYLKQKI